MKERILQLIGDLEPGGAERVVITLTNHLRDHGYPVIICSRKGGVLINECNDVPVRILNKIFLLDPLYILRLCRFVVREKIQIIHSHLFGNNLYGFIVSLLTGRKIIFTIHGEDCFQNNKRILFYKITAPFVLKIVAVSPSISEKLINEMGIEQSKVELIVNGINASGGDNTYNSNRDETRRLLGLPGASHIIGSIGNIKPVKGYDVLIRSAQRVIEAFPDAVFVIVGGIYQYENYMNFLLDLIRHEALENHFVFLGKRSDVDRILSVFDVYALPSRSEGTSLSLLEAMAAGKAIVATNVGGTAHILKNEYNSLLVPPDDSLRLADAILRLIGNSGLTNELSKNAKSDVICKYSAEQMVNKYMNIYNSTRNDPAH
jgi:glycosyltransferase involved in cell wall biosynthesis